MNKDLYMKKELERVFDVPPVANLASQVSDNLLRKMLEQEAKFVDECIRKQYPAWLTRLAEGPEGLLRRFAYGFILAHSRATGIRVERIVDRGARIGNGFRGAVPMLEAVRSRVVKGKKVLGETKFVLQIIAK